MSEPDPRPSGLSQTFKRLIDRLFGRTDEKEELIEQLRLRVLPKRGVFALADAVRTKVASLESGGG